MYCLSPFCCVCFESKNDMKKIKENDTDNISIISKLIYVSYVNVEIDLNVITKICLECLNVLKIAYQFKKQSLLTNDKVRGYVCQLKYFSGSVGEYKELQVSLEDNMNPVERRILRQSKKELKQSEKVTFNTELVPVTLNSTPKPRQKTIYKCKLCGANFYKKYLYSQHIKTYHYKTFINKKKGNKMENKNKNPLPKRLLSNKKVKKPKQFTNSTEKKVVKTNNLLLKLLLSNKNDIEKTPEQLTDSSETIEFRRTQCDYCASEFSTRDNYIRHILRIHGDRFNNACYICDDTFVNMLYYRSHMISTHVICKYECTICNSNFFSEKDLDSHMKKSHNNSQIKQKIVDSQKTQNLVDSQEKQVFVNPQEKQDFVDPQEKEKIVNPQKKQKIVDPQEKQNLVDSQEKQDLVEPQKKQKIANPLSKKKKRTKKIYGCKYCTEHFNKKKNLRIHEITIHKVPEKRKYDKFKCKRCLNAFSSKNSIMKHVCFSKDDFHQCKKCKIVFGSSKSLTRHEHHCTITGQVDTNAEPIPESNLENTNLVTQEYFEESSIEIKDEPLDDCMFVPNNLNNNEEINYQNYDYEQLPENMQIIESGITLGNNYEFANGYAEDLHPLVLCETTLDTSNVIDEGSKTTSTNETSIFTCNICAKTFDFENLYKKHLKSHKNK